MTPVISLAADLKFKISGVDKDISKNITARLTDIYKNQSFLQDANPVIEGQIKQAMYPFGYFAPRIRILNKSKSALQVHINPGPQMRVTSIHLSLSGEGEQNAQLRQGIADKSKV